MREPIGCASSREYQLGVPVTGVGPAVAFAALTSRRRNGDQASPAGSAAELAIVERPNRHRVAVTFLGASGAPGATRGKVVLFQLTSTSLVLPHFPAASATAVGRDQIEGCVASLRSEHAVHRHDLRVACRVGVAVVPRRCLLLVLREHSVGDEPAPQARATRHRRRHLPVGQDQALRVRLDA